MEAATSTFVLLEKAKNGDDAALSKVFEQYRRRLMVLVHFKLSPQWRERGEVEEVVQEVCLRAFRDLDRFTYRTAGSFLIWLSAIADHAIATASVTGTANAAPAKRFPSARRAIPLGPDPADSRTPSRLLANRRRWSGCSRG